jgi:hypothetical protein
MSFVLNLKEIFVSRNYSPASALPALKIFQLPTLNLSYTGYKKGCVHPSLFTWYDLY